MSKKLLSFLLACSMAAVPFSQTVPAEETEGMEAAADGASALSDDIYDFQLKLDGDVYQFPMSFSDFTALGWKLDGDESTSLEPNSYTSESFLKGYLRAYVDVFNMGINSAPLTDCTIGGISIDAYDFEDAPETTIEFPGGVKYGSATLDDVKTAYGEASDVYEGDLYTKLEYDYDSYQDWEFYVYNETGTLDEFSVRNFVQDEEANAAAASEISSEPTEDVLGYTAPTELGDDPLSFIVEYAGDLYQLPAPVSVFLENGWTLKTEDSDPYAVGGGSAWVSMLKDGQELRTLATNYSPDATTVENCFITSVESDSYSTDLPITVPGGITKGMSKDDLVALLDSMDGIKYTVEDSSEDYHYYNIETPESSLDGISIMVRTEDNTVGTVEVSYRPDSLK